MTNKEKYGKEILDIACKGDKIAVRNGKVTSCDNLLCRLYFCKFFPKRFLTFLFISSSQPYSPIDLCLYFTNASAIDVL